jgi:hypothetical protein
VIGAGNPLNDLKAICPFKDFVISLATVFYFKIGTAFNSLEFLLKNCLQFCHAACL